MAVVLPPSAAVRDEASNIAVFCFFFQTVYTISLGRPVAIMVPSQQPSHRPLVYMHSTINLVEYVMLHVYLLFNDI